MSKGFASVSTTTQPPTRPTAPAVEAQEIQSKWRRCSKQGYIVREN